jgi:putative hydrolase of the HAD superfamily
MEFEERCLMVQEPKFDCLLFDLDDTLYPMSSGISSHVKTNIEAYMVEKLGIEESKIENLGNLLYKNYGTTMAGLRAIGYNFDYDEYHSFVHGRLPYDNIKPDPVLKHILKNMRIRKLIFTNGDMIHAVRALKRLGLEDCFEGIICFETLNQPSPGTASDKRILCKPSLESMEAVVQIAKLDPRKTVFFDDSPRNIASGKAAGFHTVIVGSSVLVPGADVALESIHNIREALPELWESAGDHVEAAVDIRSAVVAETTVLA